LDHGQLVYSVDALGRSRIVGTYADVLATDIVRREALVRVGVSPDDTDSGVNIKTAALAESAVIQVTAEARDPVLAAAVANAVGNVGEARLSLLYPIYDLTVVTPATPPTSVYRPDFVRNGSLGLLLGLLVGVFSAYVYDVVSLTSGRVRN
jgi:capsular polysaccharide biosynthesis protein